MAEGWKLLARDSHFHVASHQTASAAPMWLQTPALRQAARRASRPRRLGPYVATFPNRFGSTNVAARSSPTAGGSARKSASP
ncbi:MAG TPA: hypothetical protein VGJ30_20255, partial [Candidatus Angelobacter sp.]